MKGLRQGWFEDLWIVCALGFEPDNTAALVDTSDNGIFEWDDSTLQAIKSWKGGKNQKDKQLHLVSYLFEFYYDLMIAPSDNVSVNGGFESCHGYMGGL